MNNELTPSAGFSLVPQNLGQAMELAKIIADSDLAPKDYRGKPGNVLIAVQMGAEVGLSPMASIQNIAVINGKPGLYGDSGKAILLANGCTIEEDDTSVVKKSGFGRCKITRPGHPPCERTFGIDNAKTALLWGKQGPWTQYPERQMAWRAFWFAARDVASDLLKGLRGREELMDYSPIERDITQEVKQIEAGEAKKDLEPWPQDKFDATILKHGPTVASGSKTAADLLTWMEKKSPLTDAQKATVLALKKDTPAAPIEGDVMTEAEIAAARARELQEGATE